MGLTVHYTIKAANLMGPMDPRARELILVARDAVERLTARRHHGSVFPRFKYAEAGDYHVQGIVTREEDEITTRCYDVDPHQGAWFRLNPGIDCEDAIFGLCEYPATLRLGDGRRIRTGIGGWRFHSCCKTQYAAIHGWEHFFACHKLVIDSALVWKRLGCDVEIYDEGGYWPGRNVAKLRENLDEMNRLVAGLGGTLKDAAEAAGGEIDAPIFAHAHFERLEAEGVAAHGKKIRNAASISELMAHDGHFDRS